MGLERQYKVCNFGQKAETRWSLKQTCQLPVSVLWPSHYFTKRFPATKERYVRTLSDCVPTTHNRRRQRIKIWIIFLYTYESFVVCPAVQYATQQINIMMTSNDFFLKCVEQKSTVILRDLIKFSKGRCRQVLILSNYKDICMRNPMVRLHFWKSEECGITPHCHCNLVNSVEEIYWPEKNWHNWILEEWTSYFVKINGKEF